MSEDENDDVQLDVGMESKYAGLKFVSFTKCVASIGGDNAKFSRRLMNSVNEEGTFFTEALTKWNDQDHGAHYTGFVDELPSDELQTYAQLLHHKTTIVTTLLKHMADEKNKSIPAFCELLSALARDLRDDFFDHMWEVFDVLINILDFGERDKDSVEAAFYCLSLLVRSLWRKLGKNIKKTFHRFTPLFGSSRDYVRRFASESFAFLMRKLSDLREVTQFVVTQAHKANDDHLTDGCAVLFFNVYKGIGGLFHSAAEEHLKDIFAGVLSVESDEIREHGAVILDQMLALSVQYVQKSKNGTFSILENFLVGELEQSGTLLRATHICRLIPRLFAEKKSKPLFTLEKRLFSAIDKMVSADYFALNAHIVKFLGVSTIKLFSKDSFNIRIRDLCNRLVELSQKEQREGKESAECLLLDLFKSVSSVPSFDLYILPAVGSLAEIVLEKKPELVPSLLDLYSRVCVDRRPLDDVINRPRASFFDITRHVEVKQYIVKTILPKLATVTRSLAADAIVVWPFLFNKIEKVEGVDLVTDWLSSLLESPDCSVDASQLAYLVGASLFQAEREMLNTISEDKYQQFVKVQECSESSIRLYQLYIVVTGQQSSLESLSRVTTLLSPAFFCSNSARRLTAMEVLASFDVPFEGTGQVDENGREMAPPEGMFSILLAAERCEMTDSRGRLMHFRKLLYGAHIRHMPLGKREEMENIILRVALAQFFVQFTLLWPGMHELLMSFARGMDIDEFWQILSECFVEIRQGCRYASEVEDSDCTSSGCFSPILPSMDAINRRDYLTARIQLLKFIAKISDLAERRTRVLSPLLLEMYERDFLIKMEEMGSMKNVKDTKSVETMSDGDDIVPEARQLKVADACKALCSFLDIFAKFSDAKSVFMEPKIRQMYEELLKIGQEEVQKCAVKCILSYKNKSLLPYKDNFNALLDEKTFRDQLVLFKISEDDDDSVIHMDHREAVMAVLLRLLYGKLRQRTKRAYAAARRVAIFRYLGGCRPNELQLFLNILFSPVVQVVGSDETMFNKMVDTCSSNEELHKLKIASLKDTLDNVVELVRRVSRVIVEEQRTFLFRLLTTTGVVIQRMIAMDNGIEEYRRNQAKELRIGLSDAIREFFGAFPTRIYSKEEIVQLLDVMVVPYLEKGVSKTGGPLAILPQSTLKMLSGWSKYPSQYSLFSLELKTSCVEGVSLSLFDLFISPLLWNGLSPIMLKMIREAIWNLLTMADEKHVFEKANCDLEALKVKRMPGVSYGTSLVVAHLPKVLEFLANTLETETKPNKRVICQENLDIINRLSDFVSDGSVGRRMASTLLAHLEKSIPKEATAIKMFHTLGRLVEHVEQPQEFIPRLAPLFSQVDGRPCRDGLMGVLAGLVANPHLGSEVKDLLSAAINLDSWDGRKVDEADHDKRHAAYNKLFSIWTSSTSIDVALIVMFAHTNYYTMSHTTDISLRTSSASNLRAIFEHVSRTEYKATDALALVDKHFVPLVLRGFKSESENVREECVRSLVTLIDAYPTHTQLGTMKQLRHKDEDLDFFVNIIHIQVHRRQRGLHRLVDQLVKDKTVSLPFEVMNRFLIPIIHPYMLVINSKTTAMADECLRLLTATMSLAPWGKYIACLDYWLNRLDRENDGEKPLIRILVAVIEAFHFEVAEIGELAPEDGSINNNRLAIREKIVQHLMPRLQKCINGKAAALGVHKKARTAESKYYNEDDDILRAPVALATVKLLQKLPESIMKQYLHGVVLKLCSLMISRSMNVRETARKVTVQVCDCLGTKYLPFIIKEMKLILNKGFQLHVMIFTVHTLIYAMQSRLVTGDLDACLDDVIDISIQDQFELASEEKEIGLIKAEVSEAKGNKTPETLMLLGRYVSASSLGKVLEKLRTVVDTKTSAKTITRVGDLLSKFAHGVKENKGLTPSMQLILVHQVLTANVDKMEQLNKKEKDTKQDNGFRNESCLIIPEAPRRVGALVKTSVKSRVHVFVEFALQLLAHLITGKRFDSSDPADIARLDPFVDIVTRCLTLKYDRVISSSLRCMAGFLYMNLPSLKEQLKSISERLFVLLADYSVLGNAGNKHTILQLNHLLFKAFTQIINMSSADFLTKKHVALLLSYVETDVLDNQKQATAFSLIKAVIRKRIVHERLPEVMQRLAELSITSTLGHIRTQCRDTLCEYIGNHPNAGETRKHLEFFCAQLEYEFEDGRLSAAETLHQLFNTLLPAVLDDNCMYCVVKLAARLVNDDVTKCRKFSAGALRKLLEGVGGGARDDAGSAACDWMESAKEASRAVGVEVLVQLSHVEKNEFAPRLPRIIMIVDDLLSADNVLEMNCETALVALLDGMVVMMQNAGDAAKQFAELDAFHNITRHLAPLAKCRDSSPIRRATSAFIGLCLSLWTSPLKPRAGCPSAMEIIDWMCWQLRDRLLCEAVAQQASKNIVFLTIGLSDEDFVTAVERLAAICRYEISHQPKEALKRLTCFKLAAALAVRETLGEIRHELVVSTFLPFYVREMNRKSATNTDDLCNLASEIGEVLKNQLGEQEYGRRLADCQKESILKTEDRKRKLKELAVTAPDQAAEMKRKKNLKKVESRKRKLDVMKPYRIGKRKHLEKQRLQRDEDA